MPTELDRCWPTAREELEDLIDTLIGGGGGGGLTSVSIVDTNSVDLGGNGTSGTPLQATVKVSPQAGNALSILSGINAGLYVPTSGGGGSGTINISDTSSIDLGGNGALATPLTATAKISSDVNNVVEIKSNGLFAALRLTDSYANLAFKEGAGTLAAGRWYLISDPKTIGGTLGVLLMVQAAANDRFSNQALMIHPSFPGTAWPTIYDFAADKLIEVKDHRGNIVQGAAGIADFLFHVLTYTLVTVRETSASTFVWSPIATITNTEFDNPASINLTGYSGVITDSYFGPGSTLTLSGGDGSPGGSPGPGDPGSPGLHVSGVLLKDTSDDRFVIRGANLEMYRDYFGGCGWASDGFYDERVVMIDKIVALGINFVRLNYTGTTLAGGGRLTKFLDVAEELASRGIYVMPSDHQFTGGSLSTASSSYAMMGSIIDGFVARGIIDYLVMNPWNEPGPGMTAATWKTAQQGVLSYLRTTKNFHGVVVLDGSSWATMLDTFTFGQVMTYDGTLNSGTPNVMFSHHLYPNITGLPASIWAAADEVPLLIGELGQENPGASSLDPSYVTSVITGFLGTGRPAGHNGLIAWILNWCDTNKMWEDWTNPSVAYSVSTPLNTYGQLWRDEYYSVLTLLYPTGGGGGSPGVPGTVPVFNRVDVIDAEILAVDFTGTLSNARITNGSILKLDDATGVFDSISVLEDSVIDLRGTTVNANWIHAVNLAEINILTKTAGLTKWILAENSAVITASSGTGNLQYLHVNNGLVNASGCAANIGAIEIDAGSLNINNITGSFSNVVINSSSVTGIGATGVNVYNNEFSAGGVINFDGAVDLVMYGNHIFAIATLDFSGGNDFNFINNQLHHASVAAKYGTISDCIVNSGGSIVGSSAASTVEITNCVVESNGVINAAAAVDGVIDACKVNTGATLDCNSATFTGFVHDCEISTGGKLSIINAAHTGQVYYLSIRAGRQVEAAASGSFEHRYGIHAGTGTYTYTVGATVGGVRDQD